jgi:hypothetical protein
MDKQKTKMEKLNIKVENMTSSRGNDVPNQFIIRTMKGRYFQSYNTIIAFIPSSWSEKTQLDRNSWDYSITTGKYRNQFLGEDKKETQRKINNGTYELTNLN